MKIVKTNLVLKFKNNSGILKEIHCCINLKTKYNIITGDSATGKTVFEDAIEAELKYGTNTIVDYNNNTWLYCTTIDNLLIVPKVDIVFCTEQVSREINTVLCDDDNESHNKLKEYFKQSSIKYIFINRNMAVFPIDYKAIFKIQNTNDINTVVRLFGDYTEFKQSSHYITEDSTSGLTYYKHHFNNVDSSNGKDNLSVMVNAGDTVIADGSAIGYRPELLLRDGINLYLPESFEYDLAKAWQPSDPIVTQYFENMPDTTDSVEQYFEYTVLPDLCTKYHLPRYKKEKNLHPVLLDTVIHKDEVNHYGITQNVAKRHSIDYNDEQACRELANKLFK